MSKSNERRIRRVFGSAWVRPFLIGLLFAPAAGAEAAADRTPIELSTPMLLTPVEVAGMDLRPEVTVEVRLDARGGVREVEILEIEPSTPFDGFYKRTVLETLSSWRYAPRLEDGAPTEATLRWTVQFRPREQGSSVRVNALNRITGKLTTEQSILRLPIDERLELLEKQATIVKSFLQPGTTRRVASPRFVVFSDSLREDTAQAVAGNLEATYSALQDLFKDSIEPLPETLKVTTFAFGSRDLMNGAAARLGRPGRGGFYSAAGLIAFHLEGPTPESVMTTLLHEATHAFVNRHLVRRGTRLPLWLAEGFADYIGNSDIKKGQLVPGRVLKRKYAIRAGRAANVRLEADFDAQEVRMALRAGRGPTIAEMMVLEQRAFYGENAKLYYPMSWMFVHFLRHGRDEWPDDRFARFFLYVAEGFAPEDALLAVYSETPQSLEEDFRSYVRTF